MRKMMVLGAMALVLVLGSTTIGLAEGDVQPSAKQRSTLGAQMLRFERWVERYSTREKVDCDTLTCLNSYLTRLSKDTARFEKFVNNFIDTWESCFRVNPLTQYGTYGETSGFVFDFGDGTTTLWPALAYTFDPTTEPFRYFMSWRTAAACPVGEPA